MACVCHATSFAQKINSDKVPAKVLFAFKAKYPDINKVGWEMEKGKYEAGFDLKKVETSVLITAEGQIVETESEIPVSELPKAVVEYIIAHYSGSKISEASRIVDAKGNATYEAEVKGKDLVFDTNGKFIH